MQRDDAAVDDDALWRVRESAFRAGEFVGQESFMTASEIRSLARRAGIAPGVSVLDLCCGTAGPGRLVASELGCRYLGVDADPGAIARARHRAARDGSGARFEVATVPPVPSGPFDVVVLLETLLAFPDKPSLLRAVSSSLPPGGRFAFTVEEGAPLTEAERRHMPGADTVWPVPMPELLTGLAAAGLRVRWQVECSQSHLETVDALIGAYSAAAAEVGASAVDDLLTSHHLWSDWLGSGRVRKFAVVAQKAAA